MEKLEVIREALKQRVCGVCFDRNDDGTCGLPEGRVCAIEGHLPEIVKAVEAVDSVDLSPYIDRIRLQVCPNCSQDDHGSCVFRDNFDCSVDNFLALVVDAIEDARKRNGAGAGSMSV
jgi:hypothetical protein